MQVAGLIFADTFDVALGKLAEKRTLAAVPFGARYRVIDFALSNLANAGVRNIGIITTKNYDSLLNHVQAGGPWDLDRKSTGIKFLPPFASDNYETLYVNRLEALQSNLSFLRNTEEKYILMTSCNYVGNVDFSDMIKCHIESGAKITALYTKAAHNKDASLPVTEFKLAEDGSITDVSITKGINAEMVIAPNTYICDKDYLLSMVEQTLVEGKKSFRRDVLLPTIEKEKVMGYDAGANLLFLDSISCYMKSSFDLLKTEVRDELLDNKERPIVTRVKDSAPARFGKDAVVTNSFVGDGVIIQGEVRNSIIFRGAVIKKGAIVENSVVMQDTVVGEMARINYAVLDKGVVINDGRMLSGYITHPFYVGHAETI